MSLFGLGTKRRRRSSRGGSDAVNTLILIGGLGVLGIAGYFVLRGGKGFEEAQDTFGRGLKNLVDSLDSIFDAIAHGSYKVQEWSGKTQEQAYKNQQEAAKKFGAIGEGFGNVGCHLQRGFGILTFGAFGKPPECSGWFTKKDSRIIALHNLTASPKPYPKMTNNLYYMLKNMGANV